MDHAIDSTAMASRAGESRSLAAAQLAAWLLLGLVNVAVTWARLPFPKSGVGTRLLMHLYDMGQMLALGLLAALAVLGWRRWGPRKPIVAYAALALGSALLSQVLLQTDLRGASRILGLQNWQLWTRVFAVLFSLCIPLSAWLGLWLSRGKSRYPLMVVGLLLAAGHQLVLPNLYPDIHSYGSWCAATLLGAALATSLQPVVGLFGRRSRPTRWALAGLGALVALYALLVPAPSSVFTQLHMLPGAIVARYKPELPFAAPFGVVPQHKVDWFRDRSELPDIPPSPRRLLADDGIIILFLADAMRGDVLSGRDLDELPNLAALKARGVTFPNAWSAAPSTNASVAALHAGKYPAQIRWKLESVGRVPRLWPDDDSPRIGDVLARADIDSAMVVSKRSRGLKPRYGLTQGIRIEIASPTQYSEPLMTAFLDWLPARRPGPLFAYLHVSDAHAPYNLGGKHKIKRDGYRAELGFIDRSLGRLLEGLRERGLEQRTLLILTADHGEAFGEHNSWFHGSTVYEEMMRVPMLVVGPGIEPRTVEQRVTTIDLAPTVFDLFGLATPATFMGQSLVPLLVGADVVLTRPIFLDSHIDASGMVFEDGTKLIVRKGVPELYDLGADPQELDNLYDRHPAASERLGTYRRFVEAQKMKFEKL